jgi:hypothetical protein
MHGLYLDGSSQLVSATVNLTVEDGRLDVGEGAGVARGQTDGQSLLKEFVS